MAADGFDTPTPAFAQATATDARPKATPGEAFAAARDAYRRGQRLDMARLAGELGVARTTLYRWTGDRDRLLSDVAWAELELALTHVDDAIDERGAAAFERFANALLTILGEAEPLRAFLHNEGDAGLRILTSPTGGVRPRLVAWLAARMQREIEVGDYRAPEDPAVLADAIVSLGERFLYHGGDPTMNPDPETARRAISLLLREA